MSKEKKDFLPILRSLGILAIGVTIMYLNPDILSILTQPTSDIVEAGVKGAIAGNLVSILTSRWPKMAIRKKEVPGGTIETLNPSILLLPSILGSATGIFLTENPLLQQLFYILPWALAGINTVNKIAKKFS